MILMTRLTLYHLVQSANSQHHTKISLMIKLTMKTSEILWNCEYRVNQVFTLDSASIRNVWDTVAGIYTSQSNGILMSILLLSLHVLDPYHPILPASLVSC